jgi:hypothetical protein
VVAEGAKGPIIAKMARIRGCLSRDGLPVGQEQWLFFRKNLDGKIKHAVSSAAEKISLPELVNASSIRWPIEKCFEEGKGQVGMDSYEHRSWPAWHRHMAYVFLALHFMLRMRLRFKKTPLLTLPLVKRLLSVLLPLKSLSLEGTMEIIQYQLRRNLTAYKSHRKKRVRLAKQLNIKDTLQC